MREPACGKSLFIQPPVQSSVVSIKGVFHWFQPVLAKAFRETNSTIFMQVGFWRRFPLSWEMNDLLGGDRELEEKEQFLPFLESHRDEGYFLGGKAIGLTNHCCLVRITRKLSSSHRLVFFSLNVCFVKDIAAELQNDWKKNKAKMLDMVATGKLGLLSAFSSTAKTRFASCCQLDALSKGCHV